MPLAALPLASVLASLLSPCAMAPEAMPAEARVESPAARVTLPAAGVTLPAARVTLPAAGVTLPATGVALPAAGVALPAAGVAPLHTAYWIGFTAKPMPRGSGGAQSAAKSSSELTTDEADGIAPSDTPLTERALERRRRMRQAPGLVDARDLPVDPMRVAAVLASGADYRTESRWLNGMSVDATEVELRAILRLPFVGEVWPLRASRIDRPDPQPLGGDGGVAGTGYGFTASQLLQIDVPSMHARGLRGEDMVIGVLDTGFHRGHEAFQSTEHPLQVLAEWDFIDQDASTGIDAGDPVGQHNHGTWILGTLAAYRPGEAIGAAYAARFVLAKTEIVADETVVEEDYYVAGLEFIEAQGADIATSSLGYIDWYTPAQLDGLTAITTRAVNIATQNGLVCVTAAGNAGNDADPATQRLIAPADAFDVITCGAVTVNGTTAGFSSDGPTVDGRLKPEVMACGVAVATVHSTNASGYQAVSGTSLSTPLVAGAAALVLQARRDHTVASLRSALFSTAGDFVKNAMPDPLFVRGYGVISAFDAARQNRAAEDVNLDGAVDARDIAALLSSWGPCADPDPATGACACDFNGDGAVDAADLAAMLSRWG